MHYQVTCVSSALLLTFVSLHDKHSKHAIVCSAALSSSVQHRGSREMLKPAISSKRPARMLPRPWRAGTHPPDTARAHAASHTSAVEREHVAWGVRTAERADQDDGPIRREAVDIPRQVRRSAPHGPPWALHAAGLGTRKREPPRQRSGTHAVTLRVCSGMAGSLASNSR